MEYPIAISALNDFFFCPYSIYLHNVYKAADESTYKAVPQIQGTVAHASLDNGYYSTRKGDLTGLSVYSDELGIWGKIDLYKSNEEWLIERKFKLKSIYQGQIYQLQAQYFCMKEMGYPINKLGLYSISDNKMYPLALPNETDKKQLIDFLSKMRNWVPQSPLTISAQKCKHCIYAGLCDKTNDDHVYA